MTIFYHQEPNLYLATSSILYSIPLYAAILADQYLTFCALALVIPTSIVYHSTKHPIAYYLDQIGVYSVVFCSWYDGYRGGPATLCISFLSNAASFYLYMWGRKTQSLIWSPDYRIATASHVLLHAVSALGYTALLLV